MLAIDMHRRARNLARAEARGRNIEERELRIAERAKATKEVFF